MVYSKKVPFKKTDYTACTTPVPIDPCDDDNAECPGHPDLLLLRDAAADERMAAAFYLRAAHMTCLDTLFLDIAEDEMHHYMELMQLVAALDPIQEQTFAELDLSFLTIPHRHKHKHPKWQESVTANTDKLVSPPSLDEMETVDLLTRSIVDELMTINKYQRYMQEAGLPKVRDLFCHIMNEEKEHLAEFTKSLFSVTHEPLSFEHE